HARQPGYRRTRSDAAPAHRVHRLTDPTARIGHVTAPEFTTLPCPWGTSRAGLGLAAVGAEPGGPDCQALPGVRHTYQTIAKKRGEKIATIAISRKLLTRAWHLLAAAQAADLAAPGGSAATTHPRPGGSPSPGHARSRGMGRAAARIPAAPDGCLPDHFASHAPGQQRPLDQYERDLPRLR